MPQVLHVSAFSLILKTEIRFNSPEIQAIGQPSLWYWYIALSLPSGLIPISSSIIKPIGQAQRQNTFPKTTPDKTPKSNTHQSEILYHDIAKYDAAPKTAKIKKRLFTSIFNSFRIMWVKIS
jgi:hypothetical protein